MENEEQRKIPIDELARMMANGFAEMRDQFATLENHIGDLDTHVANLDVRVVSVEQRLDALSYKVDQLDMKLDQHRQETKDGFDAMRRVIGGTSRTVADHEERIKELEGE